MANITYTKKEKTIIENAWNLLMYMVENTYMERSMLKEGYRYESRLRGNKIFVKSELMHHFYFGRNRKVFELFRLSFGYRNAALVGAEYFECKKRDSNKCKNWNKFRKLFMEAAVCSNNAQQRYYDRLENG